MEEEHRSEGTLRDTAPEPRYRGSNNMYRGVTISVKALTGAILAGLAALALAIVFLAGSGGFTVTFETDGGSQVPAQTCRYGELMHEVFSNLAAAEMYSCAIRGKENVEWVEVSEEEAIDLDELEDMFPDDFCGV